MSEQPDDVDQALAAEDVAFQGPQHVALVQYLALVLFPNRQRHARGPIIIRMAMPAAAEIMVGYHHA